MNKLVLSLLAFGTMLIVSCGGGNEKPSINDFKSEDATETSSASDYDPKRGEGNYNADNLIIDSAINKEMAAKGKEFSDVKCMACHKITEERLVGPGWAGVTKRRTPYWLMNFITNPDPMIDKDPEVQAMLELCLVRMPNQNLSGDEARSIYEYMREIDAVQ